MKTKVNKLARVIVLPILLMFGVSSYAGNTRNAKNSECKCVSCLCKDCKESCGEKCGGKCCSSKTEGAASSHKENPSRACCKTGMKTASVGATSATDDKTENATGSSCCKTGTATATSASASSCHKANPSRAACCKTGSVKVGTTATGKCTGVCNEKCADCKDCKEKGCTNCCTEDGCTKNGCCETKK